MTGRNDEVLVDRHERVALVVLNRPSARNAINAGLAHAFADAMLSCQDASVIVVTGAGSAFCAGLDLRDLGAEKLTDLPRAAAAVVASEVPVIAAVNGPAVTAGLELALACDFILASEEARFADTHLRVGVYPGPVLVDLPRRVGSAWARQMSLTSEFVDAPTALRIGLANEVVPVADLRSVALDRARTIAGHDASMVAQMRQEWNEIDSLPFDAAHQLHLATATGLGHREHRGKELARSADRVLRTSTREVGSADGPI